MNKYEGYKDQVTIGLEKYQTPGKLRGQAIFLLSEQKSR